MQINNENKTLKLSASNSTLRVAGGSAIKGDKGDTGLQGPVGPQGPMGPQGPKGDQGPQGIPGKDGRDGKDGKDGRGIKSFTLVDTKGLVKTYRLEFTDGTSIDIQIKDGESGKDGRNGASIGGWSRKGPSLPAGGTTGQILAKKSNADGDAIWVDNEAGVQIRRVDELPSTGETNVLYLVPSDDPDTGNVYKEYIWTITTGTTYGFELIGSTEIDLTGYATEQWVTDQGYITGINSSDVTTALGYTPYNSSNPAGYTSNVGTVTSVNNTSPDSNGNVSISIPSEVTETTVSNWGFTKNVGTVTSVNNVSPVNGNVTLTLPDPLPSQTGNSGKFLTTNGTTASWGIATKVTIRRFS